MHGNLLGYDDTVISSSKLSLFRNGDLQKLNIYC